MSKWSHSSGEDGGGRAFGVNCHVCHQGAPPKTGWGFAVAQGCAAAAKKRAGVED